jgi:hypothetical protein
MNTSKSKPLAKVFGPVLLLSAALALPVDSYAAPSPRERNAQADKANKNEKKANRAERQNRNQPQEARPDRGQERRAAAQRQAEVNRQRAAERQAAAQRKADLNRQKAAERNAAAQRAEARQAELQRKAERQRQADLKKQNDNNRRARQLQESRQAEINRRAALQRKAELNRRTELNRRAELQRRADLQRRTELQRRNNAQRYAFPRNRFYDRSNNRYQNYAGGRSWNRGDTIAVDGYLTNEGYQCQALRDDNGDLYMLVGNTYGLRTGDHARVVGRVVDGGHCDWEGIAFEVNDVTALWADRRHQAVYYHQNYDGGRFGHRDNWLGRRPRQFQNRVEQRYGYYDRDTNRYDDRYPDDRYYDDRNGNRQLIIREGRVANNRGCPVLLSGNDEFGLTGNLGNLRNGDNVKVTGFLEGPSRCAGKTIRVGEIAGR